VKLKGKLAIITGAGSGLGRAIALRFATEGARILIAEINEPKAKETEELVRTQGGDAFTVTTDVSDVTSVARLFQALDDRYGCLDILVNNAGNSGGGLSGVQEISDDQWASRLAVHLNGTFYCTREALKRMLPRKQGAIITMGSVAGLKGLAGAAAYTAAKGGIIAFTKGVALEVAASGIRVNCIAPGWIDTPMLAGLSEDLRSGIAKTTPLGRLGTPAEIASVAAFLASDESSFVVGQTISPNGGIYT
jgi:NAD(P)-dependent dehydrogenase (short-subunit alcohol dehydrogenase family)